MSKLIGDSFRMMGKGALFLARGHALRKEKGARFSSKKEERKFFASSNTGLLIDGDSKRISEKDSFEHVAVIAKPGTGKTTAFIVPNIIDRAKRGDSIIALDPSGELYEKTSSFLRKQKYTVLWLDPNNSDLQFNPFYDLGYDEISEIRSICSSLILSRYGNDKEPIWNDGAISLMFFLARCIVYRGDDLTIPAIFTLLQRFGSNGEDLDDWVANVKNPKDPRDESIANEWTGIIKSQEKMIASMVTTAKMALSSVSEDSIKRLLSGNDIDFASFREKKTILYISFPAHKQDDYQFLIDVLYVRFFSYAMEKLPKPRDISIYCLLDEFGSSYIKGFQTITTNIRKYRVSLSIVLQSISQLKAKYGFHAEAVQGGLGTYIVYAGADNTTAKEISETIGKKIVIERNEFTHVVKHQRESNLLNPDQIRTLEDRQAIFLSKNRYAVIVDVVPYWDNPKYSRYVSD